MSSQPLFKEPRAIKSPNQPLMWANESTPRKNSVENQKDFTTILSQVNSSRKPDHGQDEISSPFFHIKNLDNVGDEPLKKQTILKSLNLRHPSKTRIRLPSLIPVKRVVPTNPHLTLGSAELKEKKLLRRRLNSEDEKSLISFSKMEAIFGRREPIERKSGLNEGFQNPRPHKTKRQSQVIYDGIASAKRKTSGRKKSEDLGARIRSKVSGDLLEIRNKSQQGFRQQRDIPLLMIPQKNRNFGGIVKSKTKIGFNEPNRGRKRTCKESDQAYDAEQENTKGSSFNTDKGNKELHWMNHILGDSENEGNYNNENKSQNNGSKMDYLSQGNPKRAKGKMMDLGQKKLEDKTIKSGSRRKSSFVSLRRESILLEKSDNENISEYVILDSHLGSAYRKRPLHMNIGSQISEESDIESDLEIENINVWRFRGEEGGSSELQWQIKVMDLLEKQKTIFRSRKNSEVISDTQNLSNIFYYKFVLYLVTNKI